MNPALSMPFPSELVDKILRELDPEKSSSTLAACCAINSSFTPVARHVLYSRIRLGRTRTKFMKFVSCSNFFDIISRSPEIGHFCRHLLIEPGLDIRSEATWLSHWQHLSAVLEALPNISKVELRYAVWDNVTPAFSSAIAALFYRPMVESITIQEVFSSSYKFYGDILKGCMSLKDLHIFHSDFLWERNTFPETDLDGQGSQGSDIALIPQPQKIMLTLKHGSYLSFIPLLCAQSDVSLGHLTSFSLVLGHDFDLEPLERFLQATVSTLEHLEIRWKPSGLKQGESFFRVFYANRYV
jgi:hypothetical protein